MVKERKLKAIDPQDVEARNDVVLISGGAGVGKSWIALDFPSCYYFDIEEGATEHRYKDKLKKSGGKYFGVDQGSQDFETIIEEVQTLATIKHPYKTLVLDSKSKLFNIEVAKEMERLGEKDAFGASKKKAVSYTRRLINWLGRLDMLTLIICHEKPLWANNEQVGVTYDGYDKLAYELDLWLHIIRTGETSRAIVKKSRLAAFPMGESFVWTYEEFSKRYGKAKIEKESKPLVLATAEQIQELNILLEMIKLPEGETDKWLKKANVESFEEMDSDKIAKCIASLKSKISPTNEPKPPFLSNVKENIA